MLIRAAALCLGLVGCVTTPPPGAVQGTLKITRLDLMDDGSALAYIEGVNTSGRPVCSGPTLAESTDFEVYEAATGHLLRDNPNVRIMPADGFARARFLNKRNYTGVPRKWPAGDGFAYTLPIPAMPDPYVFDAQRDVIGPLPAGAAKTLSVGIHLFDCTFETLGRAQSTNNSTYITAPPVAWRNGP